MDQKCGDVIKAAGDAANLEKAGKETPINKGKAGEVNISDCVDELCQTVAESFKEHKQKEPTSKKLKIDEYRALNRCSIAASKQNQSGDIIILHRRGVKRTQDDMAILDSKDKTTGPVKRRSNIHANAEVQEIVAIQTLKTGGRNLLVRWKHLSDEYDTWMEEEKLLNDPAYVLFVQLEKEAEEKRKDKIKQTLRNKKDEGMI
ncbi:uncharacterized protein LOC106671677 [Cimex lectularius]|uniref:Chromo domain-containing protein n=1 Tax=Cimex lectularius TaxID=79782 RepID=A0A8I6S687_CIMLE|nr:uncharacterized protein LOC106671677 [Cimex lectularius]